MKKTKIAFRNPEAIKNNFERGAIQDMFARYLQSPERQRHIDPGPVNLHEYIHDADIANFRQRFNIT